VCTISVIREGEGPEILLVHGGASPEATWGALAPLRTRWTLASVHRRGYPPSPPPLDERQDFDVDAADILPLLGSHPHVLAHSYGVLGVLIAAGQTPENVRSLTLIEPPLYYLVSGDPEIERLERIGDAVLAEGLDADPETLRAFLRIAAAPGVDDGPLPERWRAAFVAHGAVAFPARLVQRWTQFAKPPSHRWSPRGTTHRHRAHLRCPGHSSRRRAAGRSGRGTFRLRRAGFTARLERFLLASE
jgi:pimeloyl-ACP methyl ester carboxylesterase